MRTRTLHTVLPVCFSFSTYYDMHLPFTIHFFTVNLFYVLNRQHISLCIRIKQTSLATVERALIRYDWVMRSRWLEQFYNSLYNLWTSAVVPSLTNEHISHVNFDCDIIVNDDIWVRTNLILQDRSRVRYLRKDTGSILHQGDLLLILLRRKVYFPSAPAVVVITQSWPLSAE